MAKIEKGHGNRVNVMETGTVNLLHASAKYGNYKRIFGLIQNDANDFFINSNAFKRTVQIMITVGLYECDKLMHKQA